MEKLLWHSYIGKSPTSGKPSIKSPSYMLLAFADGLNSLGYCRG